MTDKEKIRAEIERLRDEAHSKRYANQFQSGIESVCNQLLSFIDSMQEEPVSEDLEEAAKRYATEGDEISGLHIIDEEADAFKAGAKWQEEKDREEKVLTYKHGFDDCKDQFEKKPPCCL